MSLRQLWHWRLFIDITKRVIFCFPLVSKLIQPLLSCLLQSFSGHIGMADCQW